LLSPDGLERAEIVRNVAELADHGGVAEIAGSRDLRFG
jgi:hypothetical protein